MSGVTSVATLHAGNGQYFFPPLASLQFDTVPMIAASFVALFLVFKLTPLLTRLIGFGAVYDRLPSDDARIEWNARALSTVHAVICAQGAIRVIVSFPDPSDPFLHTPLSKFYTAFTCGYFCLDFILCVWYFRIFKLPFLIHATVGLVSFGLMMTTGFLAYFACVFILFELSTPFVNIRGFMVDANAKSHPFYATNQLILYVVFVTTRLIVGIPLIVVCAMGLMKQSQHVARLLFVVYFASAGLLTTLNLVWAYKMTLMALSTLGFIAKPKPKTKPADGKISITAGAAAAAATNTTDGGSSHRNKQH